MEEEDTLRTMPDGTVVSETVEPEQLRVIEEKIEQVRFN